jgi:DNA repair exonuclease SbcCD ATPase subunit
MRRLPAAGVRRLAGRLLGALLVLMLALAGCESGEEKCKRLKKAAGQSWGSYAQVLAAASKKIEQGRDGAKAKIEGEVQKRIDAEAHRQADRLHRASTSAWWRTYDAERQALCAKDGECLELKRQLAQAEVELKDLSARLAAVRSAEAAAAAASAEAKRTADAVPDDFDHAELKPARAASAEASKACVEVDPPG